MNDAAKYLGKLTINKSVVLGGSFILGTSKVTDASFNLGYAIGSLQFLELVFTSNEWAIFSM